MYVSIRRSALVPRLQVAPPAMRSFRWQGRLGNKIWCGGDAFRGSRFGLEIFWDIPERGVTRFATLLAWGKKAPSDYA